jgi:alkaline phosphatase
MKFSRMVAIARTATSVACLTTLLTSPSFAAGEAKSVILFIGNGMGPVALTAARIFKYGEGGKLMIDTMPRTARVKTYSLDGQTPDAASAMSAYMTGLKARNGTLSMDDKTFPKDPCPSSGNGAPVPTMLELAIAKGKATGVVTTARLTYATTAAAYAHSCNRINEYDIARQAVPGGEGYNSALGSGVDVLMGGTSRFWRPAKLTEKGRPDDRDLVAELQLKGYSYVYDVTSMSKEGPSGQIIGLFDQADTDAKGTVKWVQEHMSYEYDRDPLKEPTLSQMTSKAIDALTRNTKGYFLVIEGGRIEHALSKGNSKRAFADVIAFDDAVRMALAKVDLSSTLVVVTANHDHTLTLNGSSHLGNDILAKSTDIKTKKLALAADGLPYTSLVFGNGNSPRKASRADLNKIDTSGDWNYLQEAGIELTSSSRGGGDVNLFASGAGSGSFKGTLENTKVFTLMKTAFGF